MRQFSVHIQDHKNGFDHALKELAEHISSLPAGRLLFHVYSTVYSVETLSGLIAALCGRFPGCQLVCSTVSGSAVDYEYRPGITVSASVFEKESSRVEAHSYDMTSRTGREVAAQIIQFVQDHPWVKAVEIHRTVHSMYTTGICEGLTALPENIAVFGGIASSEVIGGNLSYISDQSGKILDRGIVAVYYGGRDLHIKVCRMSGWKAIDKPFTVTKAEGNIIREIDGAPAHELYKRYLDIDPDDNFQLNVLEFPLLSQDKGHSIVRNVFGLAPDGGFVVACDVNPGTKLKITYADAESVVEDINAVSRELMSFTPDVISTVSCITRSLIWQMKEYMPELEGFRPVAPCYGYLSHGELIREQGVLNNHNTVLLAAAFREGGLKDITYPEMNLSTSSTIPLTVRLSTFISRVTDELKDSYSSVEHAATTDALTGVGNRYLFDDMVNSVSAYTAHPETKYLLMFDLNGLKFVNDTFGHSEGDVLIKAASDHIANVFAPYGQCFRIGGDEFAAITDFESEAALLDALQRFYDDLRAYNNASPYILSMAVGYASLINVQGKTRSGSDWKMIADINMYKDKARFHAVTPSALDQNMSDFIKCIMSLVDNKNPVTAYHSIRVQQMSIMIAKLMQLDDETIERISLAAYLHDISKIGISDLILTKTGPLTDDEVVLLKQKPTMARRILSTSEETKSAADIVYASYEEWNGAGYPEGLSGEDIPLESRIIAAADYLDTALHSGYGQDARSAEACMAELQERSGTMFDPAVISVMLANFGDIIKGDMAV